MNQIYVLVKLRRLHPVSDHLAGIERLFILQPCGKDVVIDRLHFEVHVALGTVVAAGLAFSGLILLFRFLIFFGLGSRKSRPVNA